MNDVVGQRIVHLVPPNGGGVDRFVRDLCSQRPGDWLLHVTDEQCVLECAADALLIPVSSARLAALVDGGVLGRASALHAHSTVGTVRRATQVLAGGMKLPYVVTLHDVEFSGDTAGSQADERDERLAFVRAASRVTVPSGFMRDLALAVLGPSMQCDIVENGVDRQQPVPGQPTSGQYQVAVIGAVGQHKGLAYLLEVADALPAEVRIALIGYADGQLGPGWLIEGKLWVHGPFEPAQLPALVAGYGSRLAFFPKGQPESYCYALSDAWLAGLPAVGPDCGAIGERLRAHGGGSLYAPEAGAADVALVIAGQLERTDRDRADVEIAARSLTSVAAMTRTMNTIYAAISVAAQAPDLEALQRSAANHLDSRFFRKELLRLQGDLAAAERQRANALQELSALAELFDKRGDWVTHLQQAQEALRREVDRLQADCDSLRESVEHMRQENSTLQQRMDVRYDALQTEHVALQKTFGTLKFRHEAMVHKLTLPLRVLPVSWRARIVSLAKRIFMPESSHG